TCLLQSAFLSAREGGIERSGLKFPCAFPGIYIDTSDLALLSPREKITFYAYTLTSTCALGGLSLLLVRFINISVLTQGFYVTAMAAYLRALILCSPLMDSPLYGLLREGLSIDLLRPKAFTFLKNKLWKKFKEKGGFNKEEQSYFLYLLLSIIWILGLSRTGIYLIKSDIAAALYKLFSSGNPLAYILSAGLAIGFLLPLSLSVLYAVSLLIQTLIKWLRASNVWQSADKISFINLGLLSCLSLSIFILPDKFRELSPVILQIFLSLLALITGISARKQFKGSAFGRIFSGVNLFLIALIIKKSLTQSFSSLSFFSERFSAGSFVIAPGNIPLILAVLAGACILTGFFNLFLRERPGPGLNKGLIMPAI
ncbi:MAG: hypothetical protein KAV18_00685, partial [Candidatus Omnitrophica bacterium]|nr:hypothetical protein [Candidatus Omnitrophota bacterium]